MGRPKFFTNDSLAINFKIEREYANQLIQMAKDRDEKVSFIVRSIIKSYLDSTSGKKEPSSEK